MRGGTAGGVLGDYLYAAGGGFGSGAATSAWRYDGTAWSAIAGLPAARYYMATAVWRDRIYALGAMNNVYKFALGQTYSGVSPAFGTLAGGSLVTIRGSNLGNGSDVTNVTLCGVSAQSIVSQSSTQIVVAVAASQAGDASWEPAPDVTNVYTVLGLFAVTIETPYGSALPPTGVYWQVEGSVITNQAVSPDTRGATQYVCSGWTATENLAPAGGAGTQAVVTVHGAGSLTWLWTTNYRLTATAGTHGMVEGGNDWVALFVPWPALHKNSLQGMRR